MSVQMLDRHVTKVLVSVDFRVFFGKPEETVYFGILISALITFVLLHSDGFTLVIGYEWTSI